MGQFIEQVQKNNQLQKTILSQRQQKELQKQKQLDYKEELKATKYRLKDATKKYIKNVYTKYNFEYAYIFILENQQKIQKTIYNCLGIYNLKFIDILEIEEKIEKNIIKYNKTYYVEHKKINNYYEEEQTPAPKKPKKKYNKELILWCIYMFISGFLKGKPKKRR